MRILVGWDSEIESLLSLPPLLYRMQDGPSVSFSSDDKFSFAGALSAIAADRFSLPADSYGIRLEGPSSTTYFIFVDMRRRIIVREPIIRMHEESPKKDWSVVKSRIKEALELAGSEGAKKEGLVAVFDGYLRLLRPAKS